MTNKNKTLSSTNTDINIKTKSRLMHSGLALACLIVGLGLGMAIQPALNDLDNTAAEKKPLYWVAPMDANYRRDKPGKSPMGMDLVPVYENAFEEGDELGVVRISPEVVNNLGVRTSLVARSNLQPLIKTVGYVQYDQDRLVHIHPRVEGWVDKLYVKAAGAPVKKGQPIYELYSPQLVNAQEEFLLAMNRGNQRLLQSSIARLKALHIAPEFIEQLKATGNVKQAVTFYAPQTGFIDNLNIREGFYVIPGTTLMSIATLDDVWVEAEIFERQASRVKIGQQVSMTLDYLPGEKWLGKVDYVYPTLNPENRTARVRLRFSNARQILKPNMFAEVIIHTQSETQLLIVPNEAIIRTGAQNRVVLVMGEGRFKSVAVTMGSSDDYHTEILSGLIEGDRVVSSAQFLLDSESSRTSDFMRMQASIERPTSVWVDAVIEEVMADMGMVKLTHQPIAAWDWPVMTMMFMVGDTVDVSLLKEGMPLHAELTESEDSWLLSDFTPIRAATREASNISAEAAQ